MQYFLLILFSFLLHTSVTACEPDVDLTASGNCLSDLPPLSQGKTNNCWAFAYSTMVDAHMRCQQGRQAPNHPKGEPKQRKKNPAGFRMAPWTLPVSNNHKNISENVIEQQLVYCPDKPKQCHTNGPRVIGAISRNQKNQGATFQAADKILRESLKSMVCDHTQIGLTDSTNALYFFETLNGLYQDDSTYYLRQYRENKKQCLKKQKEFKKRWGVTQSLLEFTNDSPENSDECKEMKYALTELTNLQKEFNDAACSRQLGLDSELWLWTKDMLANIENWNAKSSRDFVNKWVEKRCREKGAAHRLKLPTMTNVTGPDAMLKRTVDDRLKKGQAVGVSICSTTLTRPMQGWSGIQQRGSNFACTHQKCSCSPHAMVVVGRKKVGNSCTYILRNSWGQGCGGYHKDYESLGLCDAASGNVYVPEEYLFNNMIDANYFQDK
jgi:hypothetical protein